MRLDIHDVRPFFTEMLREESCGRSSGSPLVKSTVREGQDLVENRVSDPGREENSNAEGFEKKRT